MRAVLASSTNCDKAISTMTKGESMYMKNMQKIIDKYDALD